MSTGFTSDRQLVQLYWKAAEGKFYDPITDQPIPGLAAINVALRDMPPGQASYLLGLLEAKRAQVGNVTAPSILAHPASVSIVAGQPATFSVLAAGTPPLQYQWFRNGAPVAGGTNPSLTVANTGVTRGDARNGDRFFAQVTNLSGETVESLPGALVVTGAQTALAVTGTPPTSVAVGSNYLAQFSATGGVEPYTYSIYSGFLPPGVVMNSSTGALQGAPSAVGEYAGIIVRVQDGSNNSAYSAAFSITVAASQAALPPNITANPVNASAVVGGQVMFSVSATGTAPITYQWRRNGVAISGATSATYTFQAAADDNGAVYTVAVANQGGQVVSAGATLTVTSTPQAADTRPRYFTGPASAHTTGTQAFLDAATVVPGSANGGKAGGPFSVSPGVGQYGWMAVLASASSSGVVFANEMGIGGWNGAGLAGSYLGAEQSVATSGVLFTATGGTQWRLFRQSFSNAPFLNGYIS